MSEPGERQGSRSRTRTRRWLPPLAAASALAVLAVTPAAASNGKLYAWGSNSNGQLGDGSTRSRGAPVAVRMPSRFRVFAVAAGQYRSVALVE